MLAVPILFIIWKNISKFHGRGAGNTNLLNPSFPENEFQAALERSRSPGKWQVGHESVTKTIVSLPLVRPSWQA